MSLDACAALVERGDPDRFLATMSAPVAARRQLFPIYAFNVEVTRAPWASREPMICEMRLQYWRDCLEEIAAGRALPAQEVAGPLARVMAERGVDAAPLMALVEARRRDAWCEPFADGAAFDAYIEATAAGLMWVAAQALGTPATAEGAVRAAGWASGLAALLRAVPALEARGRRPLPDAGPEAIARLARSGLERLAAARRAPLPAEALPALRAGWRAAPCLRRALAEPGRVAAGRLEESDFARRAGLLRRTLLGTW